MTESAEDTLAAKLAGPIIANFKKLKKFNARNRSAWRRMNRPCKTAKIEVGSEFINKFLKIKGI
jgi:hypothetical protein